MRNQVGFFLKNTTVHEYFCIKNILLLTRSELEVCKQHKCAKNSRNII